MFSGLSASRIFFACSSPVAGEPSRRGQEPSRSGAGGAPAQKPAPAHSMDGTAKGGFGLVSSSLHLFLLSAILFPSFLPNISAAARGCEEERRSITKSGV